MCGRFRLASDWLEVVRHLDLGPAERGRNTAARYNIAPSQDVWTVAAGDDGRAVAAARWGLLPSWAKEDWSGPQPINARAETAPDKPMFRGAFRHGRCLIPADGWYEWTTEADGKQPHLIEREGRGVFAFAGLVAENEAHGVRTAAILTVPAADSVRAIHHRMPAVLPREAYAAWLDPKTESKLARAILDDVETDFVHHAVDRAINSARASGPAEPINPR